MKEVFTYKGCNFFVLRIDAEQGFSLDAPKTEAFESEAFGFDSSSAKRLGLPEQFI